MTFQIFVDLYLSLIPIVHGSIIPVEEIELFDQFGIGRFFEELFVLLYAWGCKMNKTGNEDFSCEFLWRESLLGLVKFPLTIQRNRSSPCFPDKGNGEKAKTKQ